MVVFDADHLRVHAKAAVVPPIPVGRVQNAAVPAGPAVLLQAGRERAAPAAAAGSRGRAPASKPASGADALGVLSALPASPLVAHSRPRGVPGLASAQSWRGWPPILAWARSCGLRVGSLAGLDRSCRGRSARRRAESGSRGVRPRPASVGMAGAGSVTRRFTITANRLLARGGPGTRTSRASRVSAAALFACVGALATITGRPAPTSLARSATPCGP